MKTVTGSDLSECPDSNRDSRETELKQHKQNIPGLDSSDIDESIINLGTPLRISMAIPSRDKSTKHPESPHKKRFLCYDRRAELQDT